MFAAPSIKIPFLKKKKNRVQKARRRQNFESCQSESEDPHYWKNLECVKIPSEIF